MRTKLSPFSLFIALTIAIFGGHSVRADQQYPTHPITLIVPFSAGGAVDIVARIVGEQLRKSLDQTIIIENVTGAGGTIAATRVARSAPDGYTILVGNLGTQVASAGLYKDLKYDPRRDFAPIMLVANAPEVLVVDKSSPCKSLADFIALAESKAGGATVGTAGVGSISHLAYLLFRKVSKTKPVMVAYRGDLEADRDVIGGRVDAAFNWTTLALPFINSGQMRALVVLSKTRSPVLPDVPSSAEAGVTDLQVNAWTGLFVPQKTAGSIIARINSALQASFSDAAFVGRMKTLGLEIPTEEERSPKALNALVNAEFERWLPLIEESR